MAVTWVSLVPNTGDTDHGLVKIRLVGDTIGSVQHGLVISVVESVRLTCEAPCALGWVMVLE
jgi:hypothetical protein